MKLIELVSSIVVPYFAEQLADHLIENNIAITVPCSCCKYLRECRAVCRCSHPYGLKEPKPNLGTFCYYGEERENEDETD
jgi:hypothetical protein